MSFQKRYPGIHFTWVLQDEPVKFSEAGCDLWLRLGDEYEETLVNHKLAITQRTLVSSPELIQGKVVRGPANIEKLPCVALSPIDGGHIELTSTQSRSTRMIHPTVVMSTNNFYAMHRAIIDGLGFGVLPYWFVANDIKSGRLVEILPEWVPRSLSIYACYLPDRYQSQRIGLFIEHILCSLKGIAGLRVLSNQKVVSLPESLS